jgi:hypothetical protein
VRRDGVAPLGDELPALSFFDEDDEPRRTPRPRRARPAGGGVATTDSQTLLIRRGVALVGGILVLLLLLFFVNSCRDRARENALKDYNRQLSTIATDSARQVGAPFFQLLEQGGSGQPQELQTEISSFRVAAEQQYEQAKGLDVPSEMRGAQEAALMALEWRRDGLDRIAQQIRLALGDESEQADEAIKDIAGQMAVFMASDVAWETRVIPFITDALEAEEIGGQEISRSPFLASPEWVEAEKVATVLDQQLTSGGGGGGEPTGPGLHGSGLDSTLYGEVQLQPGVSNQLTYEPGTGFVVNFTNQGENDEFDVKVTLRITREGGDPITTSTTIPQVAAGESATAELPLDEQPPLDTAVIIRVNVARVPGEEKVDNNKADYPALFSRG